MEERKILIPPYWIVEYIDDENRKHIAKTASQYYIEYLKDRYIVIKVKIKES